MNAPYETDYELEDRLSRRLLDVFIRVGLVLALVLLCYLIFSPFLTMMLWALILAITIYPLHQMLAARIGGKQGLAATLVVLVAIGVIVTPTIMLASQFGDSIQDLVKSVRDNTLQIPAPSEKIAAWPIVGKKAACDMVAGARRSAGTGQEHAAQAQRAGDQGPGHRRRAGRRLTAVPGLIRHRRHHDGLRRPGRAGDEGYLRTYFRHRAWPGVCQAVHRYHPGGRLRGHRHRVYPGADHWCLADDRRRPVRRRTGSGRSHVRRCAVAGGASSRCR